MRRITFVVFCVLLSLVPCLPQQTAPSAGSIRGEVVTRDEGGGPSVLAGAHLALHGAVTKETQSDARGDYAFDSVPPGKYSVQASAPGLTATLEVDVKPAEHR